ncbi:T4SS efffector SepA family protein [Bradyrhizobium elkanii]
MRTVEIPDELYKRLEKHAKGFATPASVISMAVDALDAVTEIPAMDGRGTELARFEALYPPNLTFTKVVNACFDGQAVKPANWKRLLETAVIFAHKKIGSFDKVRQLAAVNMVNGEKTDEGYHYLPEIGCSVQGTDANTAWRGVVFLAQNLKVDVEVAFMWRNKERAENPGKPGTMRLYGKQKAAA